MSYRDELADLEKRQLRRTTRRNSYNKWGMRVLWLGFALSWVVLAYKAYELLAFFHNR